MHDARLIAHIILENIEDGVFLIDNQDLIISFNQGAAQITGHPAADALQKNWRKHLVCADQHGQILKEAKNPILKALKNTSTVRSNNAFLLSAEGKTVAVHLILTPLFDQKHQIEGLIGVMRQMDAERQAELQKTDFVSTASHEMRTPLAALEGYLSLILEGVADPSLQEYAQQAHKNVLHLSKLFKNLLTTSQSEDGQLGHQPEVFDLEQLLQEVVKEHKYLSIEKGIPIRLKEHRANYQALVKADPQRITELLNNLLDNAFKYTKSNGQITLEIRDIDSLHWCLVVSDTGLGISKQDAPHIFQKFYRIDNEQPGTGLGLFICKKIAELYNGDIWLDSRLGYGSTFHVSLPKHKS